jgi:hypothetical protein
MDLMVPQPGFELGTHALRIRFEGFCTISRLSTT